MACLFSYITPHNKRPLAMIPRAVATRSTMSRLKAVRKITSIELNCNSMLIMHLMRPMTCCTICTRAMDLAPLSRLQQPKYEETRQEAMLKLICAFCGILFSRAQISKGAPQVHAICRCMDDLICSLSLHFFARKCSLKGLSTC